MSANSGIKKCWSTYYSRLRPSAVVYNRHACIHKSIPNVSFSLNAKGVLLGKKCFTLHITLSNTKFPVKFCSPSLRILFIEILNFVSRSCSIKKSLISCLKSVVSVRFTHLASSFAVTFGLQCLANQKAALHAHAPKHREVKTPPWRQGQVRMHSPRVNYV